ncbi:glycosyltransferase family 2 protein [Lewinella sp. 4G2]|uniref:glycosyltransferase family 2 protein n=1 Tax=Lewinella sp. 4G2 TaxID=1803372 RepID=UPI0007B46EC0|nr:glycosyltransferase family 2 protein [Lewinella sp. 4G2]OAV44896.1 glycosyl transferase family 2 [Lewinella sp. 4G2]
MPGNKPDVSVIVSTYQQPAWLEKTLWGYATQEFQDFEVVVADDGSDDRTAKLIERMRAELPYSLSHVWHEDDGFRKTVILNEAIRHARGGYFVFTDGDCIPRADFLRQHVDRREPGRFLSGGYFKLPKAISESIAREHITTQQCFDVGWLRKQGLPNSFKTNKLTSGPTKASVLNRITPTGATWNGMNSSGWAKDILAANGFDERMQYGGEDRELGERLENAGIRGKQIRYSAICLHLHHERGYVTPEMIAKNEAIRKETRQTGRTQTDFGLERLT